ncbi:ketopantoate reductase family protein [Pseudooceanicola aestuarii]|uniref:ketopantoate reductase family protein n=1 Tax=Pseudooceanicola aestuarii TaxID=2697319 RepID=UPI0013D8D639|nr:2-dehydropantoate 2-reductase [Pseudooceanicola aestuarii]
MTTTELPALPDRPLNICIVGAGAIGGSVAARLALSAPAGLGKVTLIARGPHLEAIRRDGLRLTTPDDPEGQTVRIDATDDPDSLPPQDIVVTALKGHQIPPMAATLARLLAPHGRMVPIVNGVPWWYPLRGADGQMRGAQEVDPDGVLWREIGPRRAIGAIAYYGASVSAPGHIAIQIDGYLDLGRLPGEDRTDVTRVADLFRHGGWTIRETEPFQDALWSKMLGNCAMNSVAAIAQAPTARALQHPPLYRLAGGIMEEIRAIAAATGATIRMTTQERLKWGMRDTGFKPSTLQDLEKGRPMEIEPIFGAAIAVARAHDVPCPDLELATAILRSIQETRDLAE